MVALSDIAVRDKLIANQEALLNVYRCRFQIDTHIVPGGCTDTRPALEPIPPGEFQGTPAQTDIAVRDKLIANQEALLNVYRCRFQIDTHIVPGGCTDIRPAPDDRPPRDDTPIGEAGKATQAGEDLDILLDGVGEIDAPGAPGTLCVYGPHAFPVVTGDTAGGRAPVVVAARWQAGRVVALGHNGYFKRAALETEDTGVLIGNALGWAAGDQELTNPRIGVVGAPQLLLWLKEAGHNATEIALTPESLEAVDVVAIVVWNQSKPQLEALAGFGRAGGGLVTAATGWGWAQLHPELDLVGDFSGNRLLAPIGLQWAGGWFDPISPDGFTIEGSPSALTHAAAALDAVEAHASGSRTLSRQDRERVVDTLVRTSTCLPEDEARVASRLHALADSTEQDGHWPSTQQPVGRADVVARLAASLYVHEHDRTPAESVKAHPASADFPGIIPADAPRLARSLMIDTAVPRWHSTGLYAPPGELVTVTVPAEAAAGGLYVVVGAHTDTIWRRNEWTRMPDISRSFPISASKTPVANAFGGLVYINVPVDAGLGRITVKIKGAVAAPLFVLGETDQTAWRDEIRHAPAPWAEIAGRNIIVTTDAREVRDLDDPAAVAEAWDLALDLSAELAAWPSPARSSPERFVVDRQISVGYMHAGYPIMAHLDQQANLVDAEHLRSECNWGFFHEVGHNHQSDDWTFDGTVEVTVNLFTLYIREFLCGIPVTQHRYGAGTSRRGELMARYDFQSPDFEMWKSEPFLALVMYEQLQQEFGWDAFRQVFGTYRTLSNAERPKNDDEKRDQWLVRFSRQVGRNLGPFFQAWGVPTSTAARASVADMPVWMPPHFPPRR